jgi:hypothetical protein
MSEMQVVVDGTLQPDGTLKLDETPNLPPGPVRVTMQAVVAPARPRAGLMERMAVVWADQKARGEVARSREEIDSELNAMRDEAEGEMQAFERLHEETTRRGEPGSPGPEISQ